MGIKWLDDNFNIQGFGFEIVEVSIRISVYLLVCIKEKFLRMLIVLKYISVMFYSVMILRCLYFYCYILYIMKYI